MHIEILVEDSSGEQLLNCLLPRILGTQGEPHTWRLHSYKGIGRIPRGLKTTADPAKRILLDQLPKILRGYAKTPGIDAVVVVLDADRKRLRRFLAELKRWLTNGDGVEDAVSAGHRGSRGMVSGRPRALSNGLPARKARALEAMCKTAFAGPGRSRDALLSRRRAEVKKAGWPLPGQLKHEWAEKSVR